MLTVFPIDSDMMMSFSMLMLGWMFVIAVLLKIYLKYVLRPNGIYTCLVGKTAIVTGANTGIGYFTALDFAKRGARVILACRDEDKANDAKRKIIKLTSNNNVIYKLIDMTSLASVREFAKDINETEDRIDILVNNAGAGGLGDHYTKDGLQITLQVNHFAGFLLTHLLIDKLKKSAPSRIVNVASIAARFSTLDVRTLNKFPISVGSMSTSLADVIMYADSKLCNILFTIELASKLSNTGVTVNALHPGAVKTEIFRRAPFWLKMIVNVLANTYFKSAEEGAQTSIYLATAANLKSVTGKLFDNCQQIRMYSTAQDRDLARKVWQKCEDLTKLSESEKMK